MTKKRRRPPLRVLRHLQPCPDCAATFEGTELHHEVTCPLGNGVDAICDSDREYFEAHPDQWHYTRAITRAELQTLDHLDAVTPTDRPTHVHVINQPWGRVRTFCDSADFTSLALDPDEAAS